MKKVIEIEVKLTIGIQGEDVDVRVDQVDVTPILKTIDYTKKRSPTTRIPPDSQPITPSDMPTLTPSSTPPPHTPTTIPSDLPPTTPSTFTTSNPTPPLNTSSNTRDKVIRLAKEQIDLIGKVIQNQIARELKLTPATINYHLQKPIVVTELENYKEQHEAEKYKPMLNTNTHIDAEEDRDIV